VFSAVSDKSVLNGSKGVSYFENYRFLIR